MSKCWICDQKTAWKREKKKAARLAAQIKANEQGETMAIIKEGGIYRIAVASSVTGAVLEYISKHN